MIIDVDIGNSRLKWRKLGDRRVHSCEGWSEAMAQWRLLDSIERFRVSSVIAEKAKQEFASDLYSQIGVIPEFAVVKNGLCGLQLAYCDPSTLGVDRWLSMLAARQSNLSVSWLVVSAGTALTADFVDENGLHKGGFIAPGLHTSFDSLQLKTGKIGAVPCVVEKNWQPAGTTLECVQGGLSIMYQSYLSALWLQACGMMSTPCLALTGGNAASLEKLAPEVAGVVMNNALTLDGLAIALP